MSHISQALYEIFPDAADILQTLKTENGHFMTLAERFEPIDDEIKKIEAGLEPSSEIRLEDLKKQRLLIKDEIATLISALSAG